MRAWSFSLVLSFSLAIAATLLDPEQGFSNLSILKIRSNLLEIASARYYLADRYHNKESDFFLIVGSWEPQQSSSRTLVVCTFCLQRDSLPPLDG
jgi:hypothetical protein